MGFVAEVPTPIQPYAMIDLDAAKMFIGRFGDTPAAQTSDDDLINQLIDWVSTQLQIKLGWNFTHQEYSELHDGNPRKTSLWVGSPPIDDQQPVKVYLNCDDGSFTDGYLVTVNVDYKIEYDRGRIRLVYPLVKGILNNKVVYHGGFQDGQMPGDLQECCALIVAELYKLPDGQRHGLISKSHDGVQDNFPYQIGIKQYRLPGRAIEIIEQRSRKRLTG